MTIPGCLQSIETPGDLEQLRLGLQLTQADMAELMGLSRRAYVDIENGAILRRLHKLAAERIALSKNGARQLHYVPENVRRDANQLARALRSHAD